MNQHLTLTRQLKKRSGKTYICASLLIILLMVLSNIALAADPATGPIQESGVDAVRSELIALFSDFAAFISNFLESPTWTSFRQTILGYGTRLFIVLAIIELCWTMGIEYLQRGSFELGTFVSSLAYDLLMLGIGYWIFSKGSDLLSNSLLYLQQQGSLLASKILTEGNFLARIIALFNTIKDKLYHPQYAFNVGLKICNQMIDAAPPIVAETVSSPFSMFMPLHLQALFGQMVGYTQGVICLMQYTLMGAILFLLQIEGKLLLGLAPLFLAFYPLKATRQKTIDFMWAMLALGLKILMMYICVAIANLAGESIILTSLTSIAAKYKEASNAAGITGYTVSCAIIAAFCVFITKFATTLPGDITRFLSWNAPGNAGTMAVAAAGGQAASSVTGNMQGSQDNTMKGAQASQKAQGDAIASVGKMAGSETGQSALAGMLSKIPGVGEDTAKKLASGGAKGLETAGGVWSSLADQAGMAATQGTSVGGQVFSMLRPNSNTGSAPTNNSTGLKAGTGGISVGESTTSSGAGNVTNATSGGSANNNMPSGNGIQSVSNGAGSTANNAVGGNSNNGFTQTGSGQTSYGTTGNTGVGGQNTATNGENIAGQSTPPSNTQMQNDEIAGQTDSQANATSLKMPNNKDD